ncbi:MAG: T9SS type A sorting domain-containing protein [Bacteroidetes bacterium]|nr:T9SS type A sorting domain-containing protein [Bacteroidota bacterium]
MRRYIFMIMLLLPVIIRSQTLAPDHVWGGSNDWYKYGSSFYNYNGVLYVFKFHDNGRYHGAYPYFYTMNKKHNYADLAKLNFGSPPGQNYIDYYGYKGENDTYYTPPLLGRNFGFQYEGRLWYFQQVKCSFTDDMTWKPPNESFECFAQFPEDTLGKPFTYYQTSNPPPTLYKQCAFQLDSNLYFMAVSTNDGNVHNWYIQEYSFNASTNKFSHVRDVNLFPGGSMFGGYIKKVDSLGQEYVIAYTYTPGEGGTLDFIFPDNNGSQTTFTVVPFGALQGIAAGTIVNGTIKAGRSTDNTPGEPDRFNEFVIDQDKSSDGTHHVRFQERIIKGDSLVMGQTGTITLPSSCYPAEVSSNFDMFGTYELVPTDMTTQIPGMDGFQQENWFFYPNKDGHFQGAQFVSDQWKLEDAQTVSSSDLSDSVSYPGIKSIWSLTGIVDGAPPVSVNWDTWVANHPLGTEATELIFETEQQSQTEIANTYEDQWSVGENIDTQKGGKLMKGTLSEEFSYANAFRNVISHDTLISVTYSNTFGLNEETQQYGYFIWTVPHIERFTYNKYPWWDKGTQYPIPYSTQFLFRTIGTSIINERIPIASHPFLIDSANDVTLADWRDTSRTDLAQAVIGYSVQPLFDIRWDDGSHGATGTFLTESTSSTSYESTSQYNVTASAGVNIAKVFKLNVTGSYDVKYSNETTVKTEFGQKIVASLDPLVNQDDGTNNFSVEMLAYWLRPETNENWWFYSGLADQKPWYISYMVTDCSKKIRLLAPDDRSTLEATELLFSWMPENGELSDYTLFIASAANIAADNILYSEPAGGLEQLSPSGFKPEKGKTYYWAVRGLSDNRIVVWSPSQPFTIKADVLPSGEAELKALVFPNPAENSQFQVIVDSQEGKTISISLFDLNGKLTASKEFKNCQKGTVRLAFTGTELHPGIYLAAIRTGSAQVIKKVVVK